jgi:hypothetical protein
MMYAGSRSIRSEGGNSLVHLSPLRVLSHYKITGAYLLFLRSNRLVGSALMLINGREKAIFQH